MNPQTPIVHSVGELTHFIKFLLEGNEALQNVWVSGEISNQTRHGSGHVYFTLKDAEAQLTVVLFKGVAEQYTTLPGNGSQVRLQGDIRVYPPRGNYQLIVRKLEREGLGDLHRQFMELKARLEKEGLFEHGHKRLLPRFPRKIGLATSETGAVFKDISQTLARRFPAITLVLSPTTVQGEKAPQSIISSLDALNERSDLDLIILARGGGTLEDLWAFNDENVARTIFKSRLPVISAVGHETDFTISDFVADLRASTPTAAAELAVPDIMEIQHQLIEADLRLKRSLKNFIDFRRQILDDYSNRLANAVSKKITATRNELELMQSRLNGLDSRAIVTRGFSLTLKDRKPLKSVKGLKNGDRLDTILADGEIGSIICHHEAAQNKTEEKA